MTNTVDKTKQSARKKRIAVVVVIVLIGSIIFELSPFGGNARFYAAWISCGQKPVATAGSGLMNSGAMHYYNPTSLPGSHPTIEYFCTPIEAEMAGYSANPDRYVFPNIKQDQS